MASNEKEKPDSWSRHMIWIWNCFHFHPICQKNSWQKEVMTDTESELEELERRGNDSVTLEGDCVDE